MKYYLGIDPGKKGGLYFLPESDKDSKGNANTIWSYIPQEDSNENIDVDHLIKYYKEWHKDHDVFPLVEHVWAMPKQGVSSMFKFGYVTGQVVGCLEVLTGRKVKRVAPQTWQREILGLNDNQKDAAVEYVKEKFGTFTIEAFGSLTKTGKKSKNLHSGLVDAYCIAEYCRKKYELL